MFVWLKDFYKRHRKKILVTGVLAGGTYALAKIISWKLNEWQQAKLLEYSIQTKKQFHFESTQRTCTMTFMSFLPNLRNTIAEHLNTEELLEKLKSKPANKLEIWEQLKILSMSRFLCSVISNVMLLVLLRIELNVIGGYMLIASLKDDSMGVISEMNDVQLQYLNNVRYFLEKELPKLIVDCKEAVAEVLGEVSLKEKISFSTLNQYIYDIIEQIKSKYSEERNEKHALTTYMADPAWTELDVSDTYSKMTSETVDVLESADCAKVIEQCIHIGVEKVLKVLKGSFCGCEDPEAIVSVESCIKTDFFKPIDLPLAKIIPLLNGQFHDIYKAGSNPFLDALFAESTLREFTENTYEGFSTN
ncbi:peroxisomal biogenesis factor 3-like [Hydractinia symbiolongicarpus]|uniref:peroxisomal biogenesis factor 3-like n=1 Tax=Hydractinia symbiolongicarpus TaxID=13093 RepID=UPI00254CC419|nr:peroxisomal biogenesis factor 3-like [Hydractinia symbiolongicarpus]